MFFGLNLYRTDEYCTKYHKGRLKSIDDLDHDLSVDDLDHDLSVDDSDQDISVDDSEDDLSVNDLFVRPVDLLIYMVPPNIPAAVRGGRLSFSHFFRCTPHLQHLGYVVCIR